MFMKPLQSRDPDSVSVDGLSIIGKKMNVISLDSSSEEHDVSHSECNAVDLSESSKSVVEISSSDEDNGDDDLSSEDEDEDEDESDNSEDDNHGKEKSSSATLASKLQAAEVAKLSKGGDPKKLKVDDCRAYLRTYGLRISGTKRELIGRIKQHIELQEGGSRNYDRSTFTINCTGDVCKGDVVKFNQKVNDKGSRTVAGRVVKESYGAQRQQHTFTVEVLWSSGYRPLAPMKQLLVKGRNLYKRKTHRQKWADEGERVRTLAEKHERGDAARQVRAMKQGRSRGNGGTFGPEGPSMKQLAISYTDTLASGMVFQSAVSGRHNAAARAQQHSLHCHTSYVPTWSTNIPLGKTRQFGKPSENVAINLASKDAPEPSGANTLPLGKILHFEHRFENVDIEVASGGVSTSSLASRNAPNSTGANTVPLGEIRQFGQRPESREIEIASGGVFTSTDATPLGEILQIRKHSEFTVAAGNSSVSVNKHMQWFKPSPVLLLSGRGCEGQNVEHSSAGGKSRLNSGSCDSRQSVSVQSPRRHGAGCTDSRTQRHNGIIAPLISENYNSTELRELLEKPSVPGNDVPKTGFPCPTYSCTYRGSRLCSTGVCYYCCKKKGGICHNPKHRPQSQ